MPAISVTTEQTEQMLSAPTRTRSTVTHALMFVRNVAKPSRPLLYLRPTSVNTAATVRIDAACATRPSDGRRDSGITS